MATLQEFRTKYPQYDDIPDGELAERLYQKHYSDIPKQEFLSRLGMTPDPAETASTPLANSLMASRRGEATGAQAASPYRTPQPIPGDIPDLETADLTRTSRRPGIGERFTEAVTDVARGTADLLRSAGQRTSPVVRNVKGEFLRPYIGEYSESPSDTGNVPIAVLEGRAVDIDPEKHIVLFDPVTRKDQVFLRTPETEAGIAESAGHALGAGAVTQAATRLPGGAVAAAAKSPKAQLLEDFAQTGVRPSQPVVSQGKATGTIAQMLSRVPVAAGGIARNVRKAYQDTVAAVDRVATGLGVAGTRDRAGRIIQGGIERAGQVVEGAEQAASLPSRFTSFRTKADALYKRAAGLIGEDVPVAMTRTRTAIEAALNRTGIEAVDELLRNPELRGIADALSQAGELTFEAARQLRSKIGALTRSGGDDVLRTLDRAEVDRLYGAMTQDLMAAAQKAGGPQAAQALRRADQFYAAGNRRIENSLRKLFKAESPEVAYERLLTMLSEKSAANMQAAFALRRTLRPEEWNDIAATVISRMGRPTAGAVSNVPGEELFSMATFATNFNRLSDKGKDVLFGGPLRKEIEALARVVSAQKGFERLANVSASGSHALAGGGLVFAYYEPLIAAGLAAGGRVTAELLMSPRFVRWLHRGTQLTSERQMVTHMGQLQKIVQQEPQLAIPLRELLTAADDSDISDRK